MNVVLLNSDNISISLPEAVQWIMECHLSCRAAHLVMTNKKVINVFTKCLRNLS